jgi:hypothetical protein
LLNFFFSLLCFALFSIPCHTFKVWDLMPYIQLSLLLNCIKKEMFLGIF